MTQPYSPPQQEADSDHTPSALPDAARTLLAAHSTHDEDDSHRSGGAGTDSKRPAERPAKRPAKRPTKRPAKARQYAACYFCGREWLTQAEKNNLMCYYCNLGPLCTNCRHRCPSQSICGRCVVMCPDHVQKKCLCPPRVPTFFPQLRTPSFARHSSGVLDTPDAPPQWLSKRRPTQSRPQ